jgi:hypothetical protein
MVPVSEFVGDGNGNGNGNGDIEIGRLDKLLGGPKPSRSSVASITLFETHIFDEEGGKDSDI